MKPARCVWVRRPGRAVLRGITDLYQDAGWWEPGDSPGRIRRMVEGSHCFLVVYAGGRPVAMGRAISDGTNDAYIQDVFVRAQHRGRGLGAALVRRLARRLQSDGLGWIGLIAAGGAGPFYERLGFRRLARHEAMRLGARRR